MHKKKMKGLLAGTLVLVILLCAEKVTGSLLHLLIGIVLLIISVIHIKTNKKKWACRAQGIRNVDAILAAALVLMPLSGVMLHMNDTLLVAKIVHKLSGVAFILGVIGHAWQHRRAKGKVGKNYVSQELNEGV